MHLSALGVAQVLVIRDLLGTHTHTLTHTHTRASPLHCTAHSTNSPAAPSWLMCTVRHAGNHKQHSLHGLTAAKGLIAGDRPLPLLKPRAASSCQPAPMPTIPTIPTLRRPGPVLWGFGEGSARRGPRKGGALRPFLRTRSVSLALNWTRGAHSSPTPLPLHCLSCSSPALLSALLLRPAAPQPLAHSYALGSSSDSSSDSSSRSSSESRYRCRHRCRSCPRPSSCCCSCSCSGPSSRCCSCSRPSS